MSMLRKLIKFFNQPYPDKDDLKSSIIGSLTTGVIVFLVLGMFSPFGLADTGKERIFHCATFGLISAITSFLVELFFKYVLGLKRDVPEWTFWKWILSILFLLIMIAIANQIYASYRFDSGIGSFLRMLYSTFLVGIFPVTLFGGITLSRNIKVNQKIAAEVNVASVVNADTKINVEATEIATSANVFLPIKNSTKTFELDPSKVLFLQSMQNYVLIHYLDENDVVKKETHRNTISSIETVLLPFGIKRTHRSYLVNPKMIDSVSGNAQGLKLNLNGTDLIVPVSRKFIGEFRKS